MRLLLLSSLILFAGCKKKTPEPLQPRIYELPEDTGLDDLPDGEDLPD